MKREDSNERKTKKTIIILLILLILILSFTYLYIRGNNTVQAAEQGKTRDEVIALNDKEKNDKSEELEKTTDEETTTTTTITTAEVLTNNAQTTVNVLSNNVKKEDSTNKEESRKEDNVNKEEKEDKIADKEETKKEDNASKEEPRREDNINKEEAKKDEIAEKEETKKEDNASKEEVNKDDNVNKEENTKKPVITIKDGFIGNKEENVFSKVSFKLYGENKVKEYEINGTTKKFTVSKWSDANYENIKNQLVYGKNIIKLRDVVGNETVYEFIYDNKAPEITLKEDTVGDKVGKIFSRVSFKLYDEYKVTEYEINGTIKKFTVSKWSDANYENIKNQLVYGKNTIKLRDAAGNETAYEFIYDNKAPEITLKEDTIGDKTRKVFSRVSFKLYDEYKVTEYEINGVTKKFTVNKWSDANYQNIKGQLVYGTNTIKLRDVAGNETVYEFIYDNKKPTITLKENTVGDKANKIFSKVSFKLYDEYKVVEYELNGITKKFTINKWSDANYQNIKGLLVYGKNTIKLRDIAGNEAIYEFYYDNKAPTITLKEDTVGDKANKIFSKISFKLYDENKVVEYELNGTTKKFTVSKWSDANYQNIKGLLVNGLNTIKLRDVAGNETTYEFTYNN